MAALPSLIDSFLRSRLVAVVGVSRNTNEPSGLIFDKLRTAGIPVVPVNPHVTQVGGVACYPDLASIPDRPEAVFIITHPTVSLSVVQECVRLGVKKVWFHRSFGEGSWSREAAEECRKSGVEAIEGGCPMMFVEPVDIPHACMRWFFQRTGRVPKRP